MTFVESPTSFTVDGSLRRQSGDGSTIDAEDAFGSPDGSWADQQGRIRMQTDGRQPTDANEHVLAAAPDVVHTEGRPELRRCLTGVDGAEVTGVITGARRLCERARPVARRATVQRCLVAHADRRADAARAGDRATHS